MTILGRGERAFQCAEIGRRARGRRKTSAFVAVVPHSKKQQPSRLSTPTAFLPPSPSACRGPPAAACREPPPLPLPPPLLSDSRSSFLPCPLLPLPPLLPPPPPSKNSNSSRRRRWATTGSSVPRPPHRRLLGSPPRARASTRATSPRSASSPSSSCPTAPPAR